MILLRKNQTNPFALTLTELSDLNAASNWLFRFTLEQTKTYEYLIFLSDTSTNAERYNLFNLDLPTDVDFKFKGDYHYRVYQMPDQDDTDYTRGTLVEQGKMRLLDTVVAIPTFTPDSNINVYDPTDIPAS